MRPLPTLILALAALAAMAAGPPPPLGVPGGGRAGLPEPVPMPPSPSSIVVQPDWERKPTGDDVAVYYPERAQRRLVGGKAVISCTVTATGTLEACSLVSETPPGEEFGAAALKMAPLFKLKPTLPDGTPVEGGVIRVPIIFQPPQEQPDSQPELGGWITTGAPPPAMPGAGRFIHIWDQAPTTGDFGMIGYLLLPDSPPVQGRISVWTVVVVTKPADGPDRYVVGRHVFDCVNRTVSAPAIQLFSIGGELLGWTAEGKGWSRVAGDPFMSTNLNLACGLEKPASPALPTLAAALADAETRIKGAR